jgi:hypothetical protein
MMAARLRSVAAGQEPVMFEGFALERVDVGEAVLRVRHGGDGPPLLLLHGHPHIDRAHDEADRSAGRRVSCPTLIAWSIHDDLEELYGDPLAIWRAWAGDVRGARIDSGHHMAEEAPAELADALRAFLSGS